MEAAVARTTMFESTNVEVIEQFFKSAYAGVRISPGSQRTLVRHRRTTAGPFALDSIEQSTPLDCRVEPLHQLLIGRSSTLKLDLTRGKTNMRYGAGDIYLAALPDQPYAARLSAGSCASCLIDLRLLTRVATGTPGRRDEPIRFVSPDPHSPTAAAHWWQTRSYVAGILSNPATATAPLIIGAASELLAAVTLATFPNTAHADPTATERRDAAATTLRRAIAFIDENAAADISVADIAAAARVGIHSVRLAFRRHLDTTPTAYLQRVRLDQVHRALLAADPQTATVSGIATQWGFANHARFADHYRQTFGVPPTATLRGAP